MAAGRLFAQAPLTDGLVWPDESSQPAAINPDGSAATPVVDDSFFDTPLTEEQLAEIRDPSFWSTVKNVAGNVGDYAADIGNSAVLGLHQNLSSYPGTFGDIEELGRSAGLVAKKYFGTKVMTPEEEQRLREANAANQTLPTSNDVNEWMTEGEVYKPKTALGEKIAGITSLISPRGVTRGLEHLGRDVVLPFLAGEGANYAAEKAGLSPEEQQLLTGGAGMAVGPAVEGGKRAAIRGLRGPLTPEAATSMNTLQALQPGGTVPLTPEGPNARSERIRRLQQDEGVEVTGGQALGNEFVKRVETGPYAGKGARGNESQARQITRAALRRVGINADIASPEVMSAAQQQFGQMYETLIQRNNGIVADVDLNNGLTDIAVNTERLMRTPDNVVTEYYDTIATALQQNGGMVIPPDVYQRIHSEISADIRSLRGNPARTPELEGLEAIQDALYDTMGRNGQPEVQAAARELNNRYRNFKIVQKSVGGPGEGVSFGLVSPEKLRAELERRDPAAYSQGRGDFAQFVRDTQSLTKLPITGTAAQMGAQSLTSMAHAAAVAPVSSLLTARPVRTAIVNRATGVNPAYLDPMQMPPILAQGVRAGEDDGQPVPVEAAPPASDQYITPGSRPGAGQQQGFVMPEDMGLAPVEQPGGPLPEPVLRMLRARGLA